jgi:hypothetical protein
MLPTIDFDAPQMISPELDDFEATGAAILSINDEPNFARLKVTLQFHEYPAVIRELILYESDEYTQVGDWTYDSLLARIKLYYESGMSFPIPIGEDAIDIPLGTIITEEPPEVDEDFVDSEEEEDDSDTEAPPETELEEEDEDADEDNSEAPPETEPED